MGQQLKPRTKRARRKRYLERKKQVIRDILAKKK
jgi:hypothetical protein